MVDGVSKKIGLNSSISRLFWFREIGTIILVLIMNMQVRWMRLPVVAPVS